jgi:hypothetical protein
MHGTIRFGTSHDDHLVRSLHSVTAAIAEREARSLDGLNAATAANQLLIQGGEGAVAALVARLEQLGVYSPVTVEVEGDREDAEHFAEFLRERTDAVAVICVPVQPPAA